MMLNKEQLIAIEEKMFNVKIDKSNRDNFPLIIATMAEVAIDLFSLSEFEQPSEEQCIKAAEYIIKNASRSTIDEYMKKAEKSIYFISKEEIKEEAKRGMRKHFLILFFMLHICLILSLVFLVELVPEYKLYEFIFYGVFFVMITLIFTYIKVKDNVPLMNNKPNKK